MDMKLCAFILAILVVLVCSDEPGPPAIKSEMECPSDKVVKCLVNPCDAAYCPKHPIAYCKPNYCGGCKAEFFYEKRGIPTKIKDCGKACSEACPRNYDPVCGSDKKTYGNHCTFNAAKCLSKGVLQLVHRGECNASM